MLLKKTEQYIVARRGPTLQPQRCKVPTAHFSPSPDNDHDDDDEEEEADDNDVDDGDAFLQNSVFTIPTVWIDFKI